jgi:hypothetical protein
VGYVSTIEFHDGGEYRQCSCATIRDTSLTGKATEISQGKVYYRDQHDCYDDQKKILMGATVRATECNYFN